MIKRRRNPKVFISNDTITLSYKTKTMHNVNNKTTEKIRNLLIRLSELGYDDKISILKMRLFKLLNNQHKGVIL